MDAAVKFAGLSLIKQYLKTEQGSTHIQDATSGDLVEAMPFLLQVINRKDEALLLAKQELDIEEDVIWSLAVRLLKDIYFVNPNDEYRVLGLNPWCGIAEARERHRHLIRLFHPDRGMLASLDGEPDFAAIINRAYTDISNGSPDVGQPAAGTRRNNYPPEFKLGRQFGSKFKHGRQIHLAAVAAALGIYKLTPRSVWLALTIISLAFIAQKYWNNQPQTILTEPKVYAEQTTPTILAENTTQKINAVSDKPVPAVIEPNSTNVANVANVANVVDYPNLNQPVVTTATNSVEALPNKPDAATKSLVTKVPRPLAMPPKNVQMPVPKALPKVNELEVKKDITKPAAITVPVKSVQKPVPVAKDNINQTKKSVPSDLKQGAEIVKQAITAKKVSPQMVRTEEVPPASENRKPAGNAAVNKEQVIATGLSLATADAESKAAANVAPPNVTAVSAAELSDEELDRLIKNLVASYNKGDLESFTQLIEEDVVTDAPGGKNGLRQAYAKLFKKTSQREMQLKDINWQRNGEVVMTSPKYEVTVTSIATSVTKVHRGVLQFEVVRREGMPVIHAFYHLPEGNGP